MSEITRYLKHRRDTATNWTSNNPTPLSGQICIETDTNKIKIGDGSTVWNSLVYYGSNLFIPLVGTSSGKPITGALKFGSNELTTMTGGNSGINYATTNNTTTSELDFNVGYIDLYSYANATPSVYGEMYTSPTGAVLNFSNGSIFAAPSNEATIGYAGSSKITYLSFGTGGKGEYRSTVTTTPGLTYEATTAGYVTINQNQYSLLHRSAGDARWLQISSASSIYVPLSRTININGTSYDLSTDRSYNIVTTGTANRITVTGGGGTTPTIDISTSYAGQSSITTVGTIATGVWNGTAILDSYLATSYLKADGTRALTGDWAVGTYNITGIKSFAISGTAGLGYGEFIAQSSNASAPSSSGFRLFAGSTGSFNWARKNGSDTYVRTFDATLTTNRTYTLPDLSGTIATVDGGQTFTSATWNGTAIGAQYGGTGQSSYTTGDILYASSSTALSKLAGVAAGSYLRSGGTSAAPLWSTLILPNSATANRIPYATSTNTWGDSSNLTFDGNTFTIGTGLSAASSSNWIVFKSANASNSITILGNGQITFNGNGQVTSNVGYFKTDYLATSTGGNTTFRDTNLGTINGSFSCVQTAGGLSGYFNYGGNCAFGVINTSPSAKVLIGAGTATANTAPLKFTSGTNLTTPETGAIEYNGTNLFFTRTGTTRESVWAGNDAASAPSTSVLTAFTNYYGTGGTVALSTPNSWASVVIAGTTYKIPLYT